MQAELPEAFETTAGHCCQVHGGRTVTATPWERKVKSQYSECLGSGSALPLGKPVQSKLVGQFFQNFGYLDFLLVRRPLPLHGGEESPLTG